MSEFLSLSNQYHGLDSFDIRDLLHWSAQTLNLWKYNNVSTLHNRENVSLSSYLQ